MPSALTAMAFCFGMPPMLHQEAPVKAAGAFVGDKVEHTVQHWAASQLNSQLTMTVPSRPASPVGSTGPKIHCQLTVLVADASHAVRRRRSVGSMPRADVRASGVIVGVNVGTASVSMHAASVWSDRSHCAFPPGLSASYARGHDDAVWRYLLALPGEEDDADRCNLPACVAASSPGRIWPFGFYHPYSDFTVMFVI
ncbi:unnamed protein product, partial [Symbiodinium sp. KB8]